MFQMPNQNKAQSKDPSANYLKLFQICQYASKDRVKLEAKKNEQNAYNLKQTPNSPIHAKYI